MCFAARFHRFRASIRRFCARFHRFRRNEMRFRKERFGFSVKNVSMQTGQCACIYCIAAHSLDEKLLTTLRIVTAPRIETPAQWS